MYESSSFNFITDRSIGIINETNIILEINKAFIHKAYKYIYTLNLKTVYMVKKLCESNPKIKEINEKKLIAN